jgi:crotonobetainyl-CoA:carnitine CoA-transferase CaiB-like acyl-CoA transferase
MAETGLLSLSCGTDGTPVLPPVLAGDIGGGTYPAVINILLALRRRETSGEGCHLDIAMADNLFPFAYWALGSGFAAGVWPKSGGELVTGGSPRYRIYRTADNRFLAAAPIEERFWQTFCHAIGLPVDQRDDAQDPKAVIAAVTRIIAASSSTEWRRRLAGLDVCVSLVASLEEAIADPAFVARNLFSRRVSDGENSLPALPVAVVPGLRRPEHELGYALLGGANSDIPSWSGGHRA